MKFLFPLLLIFGAAAHAQAACPTGLPVTTPTTHRVCFSWNWTQGTGSAATQFNVKRATVSGGPYTQIGNVPVGQLTYIDQGNSTGNSLPEGAQFFYVVTAANGAGESAPSNEAGATIPKSVPVAPTGAAAVAQ